MVGYFSGLSEVTMIIIIEEILLLMIDQAGFIIFLHIL